MSACMHDRIQHSSHDSTVYRCLYPLHSNITPAI